MFEGSSKPDGKQESGIGGYGVGHEALALEGIHQSSGECQRQKRATEGSECGSDEGLAVAGGATAKEGGDTLEVVVRTVGECEKQDGNEDCGKQHRVVKVDWASRIFTLYTRGPIRLPALCYEVVARSFRERRSEPWCRG